MMAQAVNCEPTATDCFGVEIKQETVASELADSLDDVDMAIIDAAVDLKPKLSDLPEPKIKQESVVSEYFETLDMTAEPVDFKPRATDWTGVEMKRQTFVSESSYSMEAMSKAVDIEPSITDWTVIEMKEESAISDVPDRVTPENIGGGRLTAEIQCGEVKQDQREGRGQVYVWQSASSQLCSNADTPVPVALYEHISSTFLAPHNAAGSVLEEPKADKPVINTRPREKLSQCPYCGYRCGSTLRLAEHMRMHTGEKPFKCAFCGFESANKHGLVVHLTRKHNGAKRLEHSSCRFSCSLCEFSCTKLFQCNEHLIAHQTECTSTAYVKQPTIQSLLKCPYCSYRCANQYALKPHIVSKHGGKHHKCPVCTQRFISSSDLKQHTETNHVWEKPYTCPVCEQHFASQSILSLHRKTEFGGKTHTCFRCSHTFSSACGLTLHVRTNH